MNKLSNSDIENLTICGKILKKAMQEAKKSIKPGMSASVIDQIAEKTLRKNGASPSFLNYKSHNSNPFPNSICLSINNEVVHGVPDKNKIICEGDVVGLDLGAEFKGLYTDMAETIIVGKSKNKKDERLVSVAKEALEEGIREAKVGKTTGDIGYRIQKYVESRGFNVVRALVGHGIGKAPHLDPQIPNFGKMREGIRLEDKTAIAIEPMVVSGTNQVTTSKDGWTVVTRDGSNSAHFEHTILINKKKPEIITR